MRPLKNKPWLWFQATVRDVTEGPGQKDLRVLVHAHSIQKALGLIHRVHKGREITSVVLLPFDDILYQH